MSVLIDNLITEQERRYKAISERILKCNSTYQKDDLFNELSISYGIIKQLRGLKC